MQRLRRRLTPKGGRQLMIFIVLILTVSTDSEISSTRNRHWFLTGSASSTWSKSGGQLAPSKHQHRSSPPPTSPSESDIFLSHFKSRPKRVKRTFAGLSHLTNRWLISISISKLSLSKTIAGGKQPLLVAPGYRECVEGTTSPKVVRHAIDPAQLLKLVERHASDEVDPSNSAANR